MVESYDFAVYIGRFQPIHAGHLACIEHALAVAKRLIIVVGSVGRARDCRHPWSFTERENMIRASLPAGFQERVHIVGVRDVLYNDERWLEQVQEAVDHLVCADLWDTDFTEVPLRICLVGHQQNHTSDYLAAFPQWHRIEVDEYLDDRQGTIHAAAVREAFFRATQALSEKRREPSNDDRFFSDALAGQPISTTVAAWLAEFATGANREEAARLSEEWFFIRAYQSQFAGLKYPVVQQAVDAVVVVSGHILLVRRGAKPGLGLWALPGGFLRENERLIDAMVRELREETRLKVPEKVIRGSIKAQERYDEPMRSTRGRTITEAFLIRLPSQPLPPVKGGTDARHARWFTLAEFERMEEELFEDHFHIVQDLLGRGRRI